MVIIIINYLKMPCFFSPIGWEGGGRMWYLVPFLCFKIISVIKSELHRPKLTNYERVDAVHWGTDFRTRMI